MSAAELARRTGIKTSTMSRRMTGETAFDLDDLEVIARELGVSVKDLIAGEGEQTTAAKLHLTARPVDPAERPRIDRPRDNRPSGRPGRSAPSPTTRRPARV
jgi:transcriptional regulator with XRE-family HTH domain